MVNTTEGTDGERSRNISRRGYLATAGAAVVATVCLAGCSTDGSGSNGSSSNGSTMGDAKASGESVTILLTPETPTEVKKDYMPMQKYLEDQIDGLEIEYRVPTDYSAILPALKSKQAEIGMDDITLIAGSDILDVFGTAVTGGTAFYYSLILTLPDSDISEVSDIEGKSIAFADPLSTSGSIYALYELKQAGLNIGDAPGSTKGADFNGNWSNHESAIKQLINGKVDACATWGGTGMPYIPKKDIPPRVEEKTAYMNEAGSKTPHVRPVLFSKPIPKQPIYARKSWDSPMKNKIKDALLKANAETMDKYKGDNYEGTMPFTKLQDTSSEDYQPVIKRVDELGIDLTQGS